ncbi:MAG: response regulator [Oscillospiraceae bacterium]|nr:response regulator [Oscillospiraceae bacterium]
MHLGETLNIDWLECIPVAAVVYNTNDRTAIFANSMRLKMLELSSVSELNKLIEKDIETHCFGKKTEIHGKVANCDVKEYRVSVCNGKDFFIKELSNPVKTELYGEVICAFIKEIKAEQRLNRMSGVHYEKILDALGFEYKSIYYVNLYDDTFFLYKTDDISTNDIAYGELKYSAAMQACVYAIIDESDQERMLYETSIERLSERIKSEKSFILRYKAKPNKENETYFGLRVVSCDDEITPGQIVMGFKCMDALVAQEIGIAKRESEANRAKSSFLMNMSHDLRTPMNAIIGFSDLIDKNYNNSEKVKDYISKIKHSGKYLLSLIDDILDLTRIENGVTNVYKETNDLRALWSSYEDVMRVQMIEKGIDFTVEVDIIHDTVMCDTSKLGKIYLNILGNAYKYTSKGGKVSVVVTEIPTENDGEIISRAVITDTGRGMDKKFIPHIFEEFTREKTSENSNISGNGLGLSIVANLVSIMGGTITVESEKGAGSSFTVDIPMHIADNEAIRGKVKSPKVDKESLYGTRILLAEDNDLNSEITIEILKECGIETERAKDGLECLNMLEKSEDGYYDAVLMDIQMPVMNGLESASRIRAIDNSKSKIPIVAMTANAFEEDKKRAYAAGMNGFITKPIKMYEIVSQLTAAIFD